MGLSVETSPVSSALGVEVHGVDLSKPISPELGAELRALFFRHHLLVFRDQQFEPKDQVAFMSLISKVVADPELPVMETAAIPRNERFGYVSNTGLASYTGKNNELCFHADHMFTPQGALQGISLYATEMEHAASTMFANMVRAVGELSPELRARLDPLYVVNVLSFGDDFRADGRCRMSSKPADAPKSMYPHALHPIIERHTVTGEEYIDVSEMMSSHVVGSDDETSDRLFEELAAVTYSPDNTYTHEWRLHDLVAWDNIALQHKRVANDRPSRRTLRRVLANPYELGTLYAAAEAPEWTPARHWPKKSETNATASS